MLISGFTAIAAGTGSMLTLHAGAGLDPVHSVISEYAFQSIGWLLPLSLTLFAAGSALIAGALARSGVDRRVVLLMISWAVAMFLIGAFPTDRPGVPLSLSGGIHRYAAFVAFLVMPLAGFMLARVRTRYARALRVLSGVALGALLLVVVPYVIRMFGVDLTNHDIPAGVTQRVVVVTEVGVLALAGLSLLRQRSQGGVSPNLA